MHVKTTLFNFGRQLVNEMPKVPSLKGPAKISFRQPQQQWTYVVIRFGRSRNRIRSLGNCERKRKRNGQAKGVMGFSICHKRSTNPHGRPSGPHRLPVSLDALPTMILALYQRQSILPFMLTVVVAWPNVMTSRAPAMTLYAFPVLIQVVQMTCFKPLQTDIYHRKVFKTSFNSVLRVIDHLRMHLM